MNVFKRAWSVVSPLFLFWLIQYLVAFCAVFMFINYSGGQNIAAGTSQAVALTNAAYEMLNDNIVLISGITALISIPVFNRMLGKEWLRRTYCIQPLGGKIKKYIYVALMSAGLTLAFNLTVNAFELFRYATDYAQTAREMYAEPLYMQVLVIGILVPVAEELMFRGLIYERIRNLGGETAGVFLTSFLFGLYHGNLMQGIYAFVFSLLMLFVYKKIGSFFAPVCFHIVSNLSALALNQMNPFSRLEYSMAIVGCAFLGLLGLYKLKQGNFFNRVPLNEICSEDEKSVETGKEKSEDNY